MSDRLEYRGYTTTIKYNVIDRLLHGKIEGIDDLIMFESNRVNDIEESFHRAVDSYINEKGGGTFDNWLLNQTEVDSSRIDKTAYLLAESAWYKAMSYNEKRYRELLKTTDRLNAKIGRLEEDIYKAYRQREFDNKLKEVYNGQVVMDITDLQGKELGEFMKSFVEYVGSEQTILDLAKQGRLASKIYEFYLT